MIKRFEITEQSFEYLAVQVGALSDLRHMRPTWEIEYSRILRTRLGEILPHIPRQVGTIMDVGSGLGGIDVLLSWHYMNNPRITLVDGGFSPPVVEKHDRPFCNGDVAIDFQRANGVQNVEFMDIEKLRPIKQDLILSFQAWCFHIRPKEYREFVLQCCKSTTALILDVRRTWVAEVLEYFDGFKIAEGEKFERWRLAPR